MLKRLLDARWWYVGKTYAEFGEKDYDCFTIIVPYKRYKSKSTRA